MIIDYEINRTTDGIDHPVEIQLNITYTGKDMGCEYEYIDPSGESRWYTVEGTFDGSWKDDCEALGELSETELDSIIRKMRGDP